MITSTNSHFWILETSSTAYSIALNANGTLVNTYWGPRLRSPADYPFPVEAAGWASFNGPGQLVTEEYPAWGGASYVEPCLKTTFSDGTRDTALRFITAAVSSDRLNLTITLRDAYYPLWVDLHYCVYEEEDLIERWAELRNTGTTPITLERVFSAQWHFPRAASYRLSHLSGRWNDEFHLDRETLFSGVKVLESRRITTSHHANPWFALDFGSADEDNGEVWFGVLAWSGNWKLTAEVTDFQSTRLSIGLNDWDFAWRLLPGETFTTPSALAGFTTGGFGAASRSLHAYIRARVLPHASATHKILYNSWEATQFDVDEASQSRLAEIAARLGVELFVLDDGWFHNRTSDRAGLGDWWPDERKFPHGLSPLIRRVNDLGMDFGIWVEPEMVSPDSDLYRAHPDWVLHFPNRPATEMRNQLILNFARPDVQDCILAQLDRLLSENNIAFVKWDMNRNVSEPGWPGAPGDPREVWVRYVQGLYRVWGELRSRYPSITWQSCSGGGGRADLGILHLADQIWPSDNTEATARLSIQEGFSQVFPANVMEAWVTDAGNGQVPLSFRFHTSMCGCLGLGGNLFEWTQDELDFAAQMVQLYKSIRQVIQQGQQYRLLSPQSGSFSAVQYMNSEQSEGVLFAFRTWMPDPAQLPTIYLRGLDLHSPYLVEGFPYPRSGQSWMSAGLSLPLFNLESALRRIWRVGG